MSASAARRARRAELGKTFVTDGRQRIVEGVRYDILPLPGANCSNVRRGATNFTAPASLLANAFNPTEANRKREYKPREKPVDPPDCDGIGCSSFASHFTDTGKWCISCFSQLGQRRAPARQWRRPRA